MTIKLYQQFRKSLHPSFFYYQLHKKSLFSNIYFTDKFRTQNSILLKFQSFCIDGAQVAAVYRPKVFTASFSALPIAFFHQQHIHDTKNFYASCVLNKFVVRHKTNTKFIHAWYFIEILNTNVPRNWMQ